MRQTRKIQRLNENVESLGNVVEFVMWNPVRILSVKFLQNPGENVQKRNA